MSNGELTERKNELPIQQQEIEGMSASIHNLLKSF